MRKAICRDARKYLAIAHENDPCGFRRDAEARLDQQHFEERSGRPSRSGSIWLAAAPIRRSRAKRGKHITTSNLRRRFFAPPCGLFPLSRRAGTICSPTRRRKRKSDFRGCAGCTRMRRCASSAIRMNVERFSPPDRAPEYLSEQSVILGGGIATQPWHGANGWFEWPEKPCSFFPCSHRPARRSPIIAAASRLPEAFAAEAMSSDGSPKPTTI